MFGKLYLLSSFSRNVGESLTLQIVGWVFVFLIIPPLWMFEKNWVCFLPSFQFYVIEIRWRVGKQLNLFAFSLISKLWVFSHFVWLLQLSSSLLQVYMDGTSTMSTQERKASLGEFYGELIFSFTETFLPPHICSVTFFELTVQLLLELSF